jgi:hypothetical protein
MTEKLLNYQIIRSLESGGTRLHLAVQTHTNTIVMIKQLEVSAAAQRNIKALMQLVQCHPLNVSPYALKTLECFYDGKCLSIVQEYMDIGPLVKMLERSDPVLTDDFVLYTFMQVIYATKMHKSEDVFCRSMSIEHIWLNALGRVQMCWVSILLSNDALLEEWVCKYQQYQDYIFCNAKKLRTQEAEDFGGFLEQARQEPKHCDRKIDRASESTMARNKVHPAGKSAAAGKKLDGEEPIIFKSHENLRSIFFRLVFRCRSVKRMGELMSLLARGEKVASFMDTPISNVLYEFASILYGDGHTSCDAEKYIRRIIQNRTISSCPQVIFRIVSPLRNSMLAGSAEIKDMGTPGRSERSSKIMSRDNLRCTTTRRGRFLIEEFSEAENNMNSPESGGGKDEEGRMWSSRTREYKRGRFYVCEAIPSSEGSRRDMGNGQYTKKLLKMIDIQAQQINLLLKVLKKSTNMDRLVEEEFRELAEQADSLMFGLDSPT